MSKRVLRELVEGGHVRGWDDPRMPTLSGMRRRGYPPAAIRRFWEEIGVAKRDNMIQLARLEHAIREELNRTAPRAMAVLRPLRVVIENYPEDAVEELDAVNNPEDAVGGHAQGAVLARAVDRARGLRGRCRRRASTGSRPARRCGCATPTSSPAPATSRTPRAESRSVRCRYDPATRGGDAPDGRKVRGTLHWVSARHALQAEVRLYDVLFTVEDPLGEAGDGDFTATLNPELADVAARLPARAVARVGAARAIASSSSASATSASIPTRGPARPSGTAPSPCATPGPRWPPRARSRPPERPTCPSAARASRSTYCTQCRWLLRAAWVAQELLTTFEAELGEVALRPGTGGVFEVRLDGELIFSRASAGRFPEAKELKQAIRDRVAPERSLGHSDSDAKIERD